MNPRVANGVAMLIASVGMAIVFLGILGVDTSAHHQEHQGQTPIEHEQ